MVYEILGCVGYGYSPPDSASLKILLLGESKREVCAQLSGLRTHADKLTQWGIDQEYIDKLFGLFRQVNEVEQKRNAIKASSQLATAEQERLLSELESNCTMVKRLVRFELDKELWPEFGFRKGESARKKTEEAAEPEKPAV